MVQSRIAFLVILMSWFAAGPVFAQGSVFLEELTWPEVRDAVKAGKTTVIIPTGGTEQNGPHMVLGKHNIIVKHTSGEIAKQLGDALVAPVIAYVPEGGIDPPTGMMAYAGSISLPEEHFIKLLEFAARSLKVHGFTDIAFIGDSGGNQKGAQVVADALNKEWASTPVRVHAVAEYYTGNGFPEWLLQQGETKEGIGSHATITDTSQVMVLYPAGIRRDKVVTGRPGDGTGITGDPTRASEAYGKKGLELKIATGVRAIRELRKSSRRQQ